MFEADMEEDMDSFDNVQIKQEQDLDEQQQHFEYSDPSTSTRDTVKLEPCDSEICRVCGDVLLFNVANIDAKETKVLEHISQTKEDNKFPPGLKEIQLHVNCKLKYFGVNNIDGAVIAVKDELQASVIDKSFNGSHEEQMLPDVLTSHQDSEHLRPDSQASLETESVGPESSASETCLSIPTVPPTRSGYCRICDCALTRDAVLVRRLGMKGLQRASEQRMDGKFPPNDEQEIRLHGKCRINYTNVKVIAAALNRRLKGLFDPSSVKPFDYLTQCVICGDDASEEFIGRQSKLPLRLRKVIDRIRRPETGQTIYMYTLDRSDADSEKIRDRLKDKDLVALDARYHTQCYQRLQYRGGERTGKQGRQPSQALQAEMDKVYQYIRDHHEDSQFSFEDILRSTGVTLGLQFIGYKFQEHYDVCLIKNKNAVLTQKEFTMDDWHEQKLDDERSERLRIVRAAANIVLEDIRSVWFDNGSYPPPDNFLDDVGAVIPETLKTFVDTVVTKYRDGPETARGTAVALSHSVVAAARPRTFKSPLLLGIGSFIRQKRDPKKVIDLLSSIGFCASYDDVAKFETSVAHHDRVATEPEFRQFVFDVVDAQTEGYAGPALVGVQCDAPKAPDTPVRRRDTAPPAAVALETAVLKKCPVSPTLGNVVLEELDDDAAVLPTRGDALWLFGTCDPLLEPPGWHAFMASMPAARASPAAELRALPAVLSPPTDDAVYTALRQARSRVGRGEICLVTFDRPLYRKALSIVRSYGGLSDVVLRLGTFHLMTSFLGTVGRIMSGGGLRELWCSVFPAELVATMMNGRAYSAAMRAHLLTRSALFGIITKNFDLTADERLEIEGIIDGGIMDVPQTESRGVKKYQDPLAITLELLEARGPTAKLWVQYFRMSTLAARLVEAERGADWELHLSTLRKMLPYFHAGGNFEYAEACSLYLQEMRALETKMSAEKYEAFTKKGYFTIRRTDKVWADVWSDRAVEQTMSAGMKATVGGGATDDELARIHSAGPKLSTISDLIEDFCRPERNPESDKEKSNEVIKKFRLWFEDHDPFLETEHIVSIATGLSGRDGVNCHEAEEVGKRIMSQKVGENFQNLEYRGDDCVRPLSLGKSVINIDGFMTPIDPDTILKRIKITKKNADFIFSCFEYELAPYPLSLFDEHGMLEANKSALFELFIPVEVAAGGRRSHVIDGEFLLHRKGWKVGENISEIINKYTNYVKNNFTNPIIVFGRQGSRGTPMMARSKAKSKGPTVELQKDTVIQTSPAVFLPNEKNKHKLIQYLIIDFAHSGINVKLPSDDAHSFIVQTAIDKASTHDDVCVVSDDVELLVLLCARANKKNIYLMKPRRGRKPATYYHTGSFRTSNVEQSILFIHAISGCDTTSAIFRKEKAEVASVINSLRLTDVTRLMKVFTKPNVDPSAVANTGEWFMQALYNCRNLNEKRFNGFTKMLSRSRYDLACLPPTSAASIQHVYRTYHQIQKWLGNDLPATDWGWELVGDRLEPLTTSAEAAPKELLDLISCKCKGICLGRCVCKRSELDCCVLCLNCRVNACHGIDMDAATYDMYGSLSATDNLEPDDNVDSQDESDEPDESEHQPRSSKRLKRDTVQEEPGQEMEHMYIVEQNELT